MLRLAAEQDRCTLAPGTEAVVTLSVTNEGELVEDVELEPLGVVAGWCRVEPATVRPAPGATEAARLILSVPPDDKVEAAATRRLLVRARSLSDAAVVSLAVHVTSLSLVLDPPFARVHRQGQVHLTLHRAGGASQLPVAVRLRATPDDDGLELDLPAQVTVGDQPVTVPLAVRPARSGSTGYRIEAVVGDEAPTEVAGRVEERGAALWPALVVTVVVLTLVLGAVLLFGPELTPRPN